MRVREVLVTAALAALARPTTWVEALAAFLLRGGIVAFLLPIVVLPSPVGLGNLVGPSIVSFVLGGLSAGLVAIAGLAVGLVLAWILAGGLLAAATEVDLIGTVAGDEDVAPPRARLPADRPVSLRDTAGVLVVRLVAHVPLLVALTWGATRAVAATYAELTIPTDVRVPIAVRVVTAVPEVVILVAIAWVLGEMIGAMAARRVVLDGASTAGALRGAGAELLRRPIPVFGLYLLPTVVLVLVLVPAGAAAAVAWRVLRATLEDGAGPLELVVALGAAVTLWTGGLVLAGMVASWRAAAWTVAAVRSRPGTFGVSPDGRDGDWRTAEPSGTV